MKDQKARLIGRDEKTGLAIREYRGAVLRRFDSGGRRIGRETGYIVSKDGFVYRAGSLSEAKAIVDRMEQSDDQRAHADALAAKILGEVK